MGRFDLLDAGLPAAIVAVALLAYRYPDRPWRWALILFETQFFAMCATSGELGNLWPLGMLLFALIALPAFLAGWLAARLGRRPADEAAE